jgi:hypothetical protein
LADFFAKEMSKRPEMKRDGTGFFPRVRGSSKVFREQAARQGKIDEGQNMMKGKIKL